LVVLEIAAETPALLVLVAVALGPGLLVLTYLARLRGYYWVDAAVGGGGWLLAYLIRLPLIALTARVSDVWVRVCVLALMAGVFEESIRYVLIRARLSERLHPRSATVFGLGWGLAEAFIIYCANLPVALAIANVGWEYFLPGAVERDIAIIFHVTAACLIAVGIAKRNYAYLCLAIILHTMVNVVGAASLIVLRNPWLTEGILALVVSVVAVVVLLASKRVTEWSVGEVSK